MVMHHVRHENTWVVGHRVEGRGEDCWAGVLNHVQILGVDIVILLEIVLVREVLKWDTQQTERSWSLSSNLGFLFFY
jgi:hypothetical protein